ncbi:DUF3050 domain-containing protein [Planctomicrobium sp. SH661]|uniref:DUF3050 domain-containing protein n=1 Tax=Planctomicrobium sp. SH661 TaxID=3448124 RepID=UPI003F5C53CD
MTSNLSPSEAMAGKLQPAVDQLLAHPLYTHVQSVPRLRIFMREHAFAVWDFMTLLKRLQLEFCGPRIPWTPPEHPQLARFINEIVLGEESDTNDLGGFASHFELYLSAMADVGSDTAPIRQFIEGILAGKSPEDLLDEISIRDETREFVKFNLRIAREGAPWEVAAVFCYGREDVIPAMFERLLMPLAQANLGSQRFEYYLQRHIELDGNEHGPLSQRLVQALVGEIPDRANAAATAGERAIRLRIHLWDGILNQIERENV